MDRELFGQRFKAARVKAGIKQSQAAKLLGVRRQRIAEYDRGLRVPTLDRLLEIAEKLGLNIQDILPPITRKEKRQR